MASVFDEQRGRLCTVCYHQFSCHGDTVPRILTCGHSFCTGCLSRLLGQLAHGHIRCPTCKGDTLVPGLSNDITKLSKNFGVLEILESIEDGVMTNSSASNPIPFCNEHDDEPMKVFCIQDDQLICIYCQFYGAHQGHQCRLVTILAEETRKTVRSFIKRLGSQKDSMVAVSQAVNDTVGAVQIKEDKLMYEVTRHFEMLRRKLYQRENQVKILLRNRMTAKVMLLDKQKRELQDLIGKVDKLSVSCQSALTGLDCELVQQKTKLETDFHSLCTSVEDQDLRPCIKDDLHCHLDPSMLVQLASHGMLVKEPIYKPQSHINPAESATASTSTSATVTSPVGESVGSAGDANRQEGDCEHIEWPTEIEVSGRNTRQQSSPSDVIVIYDDMDLETAASSSNPIASYQQQQQQQQSSACRSRSDAQHTCGSNVTSSPRQSTAQGHFTQTVANRRRAARGTPRITISFRGVHGPTQGILQTDHSSSSSEADSPLLSELSDMELERPLRSAWTNRGGWSADASAPSANHVTPSALADGTAGDVLGDVLGDVASGVGTGEANADSVVGVYSVTVSSVQPARCSSEGLGSGDVGRNVQSSLGIREANADDAARDDEDEPALGPRTGSDVPHTAVDETRRGDEADTWEVNATLSPRRQRRQGHPSSQHQRNGGGLMCSVNNCTSSNCNFYVRCKNCSRLFCQKCVSTSISARRCYKRPRGHSFMYIPLNPGNASANNNQLHQRYHHLMHHHSHQRSSSLRQHEHQPGPRPIAAEARASPSASSWHCLQCLTVNQPQNGIQRCISCGQVNMSPREVENDTELMTFPPSPDDNLPSSSGAGDTAHSSEADQENPAPATESMDMEIRHEDLDLAEVHNVEDSP